MAKANQHNVKVGRSAKCMRCWLKARIREARQVFGAPCTEPARGEGRDMSPVHGLRICVKCGSYSQGAAFKAGLKGKCKKASKVGASNKDRVSQGFLPYVGRHLTAWPDGAPLKTEAAKRKGRSVAASSGSVAKKRRR